MATIVTDILCDLTQPVKVQYLHGNLFSQDNAANTINVHVHSAGVPESLGGTISANVIRSDGGTVAVAGSVSGDTATVVLPQACYAVPGVIHIIIKSTVSSVVTTIAAVVANVYTSSTDTVVDPGTIITDVAALIDAIENAVDSIPVDYSGLLATIAADYSPSKTYPVVGMYAWQGGVLKRNIVPITTAETYTAAHWTNAVLGDDVSALKSAISVINPALSIEWTLNKTMSNNGVISDSNYMALSQKIPCSPGDIFTRTGAKLDSNNKALVVYICEFNEDTFVKRTELTGSASSKTVTLDSTTTAMYIAFGRYSSSQTTISQTDITTYFSCTFTQNAAQNGLFNLLKSASIKNQYIYSGADVNSIAENSFYYCSGGTTNLPTASGDYFVMTVLYNTSGTAMMQIAYKFSNGQTYYRKKSSGSWSSWNQNSVLNFDPVHAIMNKYAYSGNNLNDVTDNSFIFSAEGTTNNPTSTGGYFVLTVEYSSSNTNNLMQVAFKFDNGMIYYRRKSSGSWKRWYCNTAPANPSNPKYYAFGDSLTYSAVWTQNEPSGHTVTQASKPNQIPTRIANAVGAAENFSNQGVGGAYFVGDGDNTIINAIKAVTMTGAGLITVGGGRNDSSNPLGDKNSTIGDGTICGAIKEIIEYLQTNYKKTQIVWIGVTPNTSNNATVFTKTFAGGWSLNSFDEKVSELCAEYCVPYVSWKGCTYMKHWADFSGADGVYSHPNNEESYLQMGNYIAGQVAQYYRG